MWTNTTSSTSRLVPCECGAKPVEVRSLALEETIEPLPEVPLVRVVVPPPRPGAYCVRQGMQSLRRAEVPFGLLGIHTCTGSTSDNDETPTLTDQPRVGSHSQPLPTALLIHEPIICLEAQPVPTETQTQTVTERDKTNWKFPLVVLALLLVIALSLLVSLANPRRSPTMAPPNTTVVLRPSLSPSDRIRNLLPEKTKQAIQDAIEPPGPQAKAFAWLLEDPFLLDYPDWRILQRFSLATLFYATEGSDWGQNTNWLSYDTHECHWYNRPTFAMKDVFSQLYQGLLIEFQDDPPPPNCDTHGQYQHLWLDANNLRQTIPDEFFLLTSLHTLSMGQNLLHGTFPTLIGAMTQLQGLALFSLQIQGTIPSQIGLLKDIRMLAINHNNLEGEIPTQLWNLTNLQTFILGRNSRIVGTIPKQIATLQNLRWFASEGSSFSGTIPTQIGTIHGLVWVVLAANLLTGTIPTELGQLSRLQLLHLPSNQLTGSLPTQLGLITHTTMMAFGDNLCSGSIPTEYGRLTNLTFGLFLDNNPLLTGSIPTQLGLLTSMKELNLDNNHHVGPIPSELGLLKSLGRLGLANNSLTGTIPKQLSWLKDTLYALDLHGNTNLSGSFSEDLCGIHATCTPHSQNDCKQPGLHFTCTDTLCGCQCSCGTDL